MEVLALGVLVSPTETTITVVKVVRLARSSLEQVVAADQLSNIALLLKIGIL